MKFGVFISAQQPRSDDPVRRFREAAEQARLAKQAGFDALAAGHHYLSPPYQSLQSLPLLARLAAEAPGRLRIPLVMRLADLAQHVADAARSAQLASDIRREAQIAGGVEPTSLGIGRQFAHDFGEGAEDRLDIARFEPSFAGHAARLRAKTMPLRHPRPAMPLPGDRRA